MTNRETLIRLELAIEQLRRVLQSAEFPFKTGMLEHIHDLEMYADSYYQAIKRGEEG